MKRFVLLIVIAIAAITLHAQVITWAVKPGVYSKIEPCWGDMYFAYKGNNYGVINGDGKVIVPIEASRITGFYEGFALVLKSDGGKERVLGILSSDGTYSKIDGIYYTIPYQEFFSERLLTVTNPNGQACYMNTNGVVVKSFDVSFISPFSEGYAVVGENEDFTIVDKRFNAMSIQLGIAQVNGGSNVYKGVAIIWDGDGKFYNYDVRSGRCKKISEPNSLDYDYMYCFSSITKRSESVPYEQPKRSSQTLNVTKQGNKYGYITNNKTILPYQFEEAEDFYGNYAIVKSNGMNALLAIHNTNDSFNASAISDIKYKQRSFKDIPHKFEITIPSIWNVENVTVKLWNENGTLMNISNNGGLYEFKADGATGTKKYDIEIDADGLHQWNGEIVYSYTIEKDDNLGDIRNLKSLSIRLEKGNTQANEKNLCCVKAYITNPNPEDITTKVMWSGSSLLEGSNTTITVPANGSKVVSIYLKVLKAQSGQSVTVTTNAGGSDTISGLQLIPF